MASKGSPSDTRSDNKRYVNSAPAGAVASIGLLLLSCAGPNGLAQAGAPGFWRGLLHGILAPITFLISLFSDQVSMYEVHNAGHWYDFGFLVGLCAVLGGSAARRAAFRSKPPPKA